MTLYKHSQYCHIYIGTIVSKTYGVAKKTTAIAVRVLNQLEDQEALREFRFVQ